MINIEPTLRLDNVWDEKVLTLVQLRQDGVAGDPLHSDFFSESKVDPATRVFSLTYFLAPPVADSEISVSGPDVSAMISSEGWHNLRSTAGEREVIPRGDETWGAFGPFVLTPSSSTLFVEIASRHVLRGAEADKSARRSVVRPRGLRVRVTVDLKSGAARIV